MSVVIHSSFFRRIKNLKRGRGGLPVLLVKQIPRSLKDHFNAACARHNVNATSVIILLMNELNLRSARDGVKLRTPKVEYHGKFTHFYIRGVPWDVYKQFKAYCRLRRKSIIRVVRQLMIEFIEVANDMPAPRRRVR